MLRGWLESLWDDLLFLPVKGSLARHYEAWVQLQAHPFLLEVVREGYSIPFHCHPPPCYRNNNMSVLQHEAFLLESMAEFLCNGFVVLLSEPPYCVNPLQVAIQPNGKKRVILDLTHVNKFIPHQKFKMDTLQLAAPLLPQGGWCFSYDICKGFFHIDVAPEFRTYLGFSFDIAGVRFYGEFTVCPFGLAPVPRLFHKILRPLVTHWRAQGMTHFLYLDDGLGACPSREACAADSISVRQDLASLGFVEQPTKCHWEPTQSLTWLGFIIDLRLFGLSIPLEKLVRLRTVLDKAVAATRVSARSLLSIAGRLNSMSLVYGSVALILAKPFYVHAQRSLDSGRAYGGTFPMPQDVLNALKSWRRAVDSLPTFRSLNLTQPTLMCFSDASASGGGSLVHHLSAEQSGALALPLFAQQLIRKHRTYELPLGDDYVSETLNTPLDPALDTLTQLGKQGTALGWPAADHMSVINWTPQEASRSSTYRELKALLHGLCSLAPTLAGRCIYWATDNQAVEAIMLKGSMKPDLQQLAVQAFALARSKQIALTVLWVPRTLNLAADELSRLVDCDDWMLVPEFFALLDTIWGPHHIDRFSSHATNQLPRFNSRFACPNSEGVDCFNFHWRSIHNWLVPPPRLVPAAVRHLQRCQATGTLVVPYWPSASFWPLLFPRGAPAPFVQEHLLFPNAGRYIRPGPQPHSIFDPVRFQGGLMALRLSAN